MRRRQFLAGLAASATTLAAPALALSPEHKRLLGAGANGPSLDLNFLNTGSLDGRITFTRASNATYFDTTGTLQTATTNVPRFDNDPVTLASLGLLIEEQRTNGIRNPRAEGAVVSGAIPTNWFFGNLRGLAATVTSTTAMNGVPGFALRLNGTPTGTGGVTLFTDTSGVVAASSGQTWSVGGFLALVGGTLTNVTPITWATDEYNGSASLLVRDSGSTIIPTATLTRYPSPITLVGGTTASIAALLSIGVTLNQAVDVTLFIGAPQLELGGFATSTILPPVGTPAAATRASESASMALGPWYSLSQCSYCAVAIIPFAEPAGVSGGIVQLDDGTNNNRLTSYVAVSGTALGFVDLNAGVHDLTLAPGSFVAGSRFKTAVAISATTGKACLNGAAPVTGVPANFPGALLTTLRLGTVDLAATHLNGWLQRLSLWPRLLSTSELQQVTT